MGIKVTSVSKKEQTLSRTPAAIFVISAEDIRRSGARNVPDLLRMVPGMDVAQIDANTWAISARGLNGRFSNKLLVLIDGRTVYIPTFGGVFWDVLNLPLEDIERIEVIRGPGGSVWGTNAVNGVINILTKKASQTHGGLVDAEGGNIDQGAGTAQYGGSLGKNADYRLYSKYFNEDHFPNLTGQNGGDGWNLLQGGFRVDATLSSRDTLMVQGSLYASREGQITPVASSLTEPLQPAVFGETDLTGSFVQSAWNHTYSTRSDSTLQLSIDHYERDDALREARTTYDLDFQHHFAWTKRHDIVWGFGYRYSDSQSNGNLQISLNPPNLSFNLFSAFLQDEIALVPDRLYLTVGAKLEHNPYTGLDPLPTARVAWAANERHTLWAAVSRADRTPASIDIAQVTNIPVAPEPNGTPVVLRIEGNPNVENETLLAYELGYRAAVLDRLSFDFAAYYDSYSTQKTTEPAAPFLELTPAPPHLVLPFILENLMHGEAHGLEVSANWKVNRWWTLSPAYAFETLHMHLKPASHDTTSVAQAQGSSPPHWANLRSHLELPHRFAWDACAGFVSRLADPNVASYTRLDTQLSWRWTERTSFSLVGQNLLRDHHLEFVDLIGSVDSSQIKRSAYAKVTWRF